MSAQEIATAEAEIKRMIPDFDYASILAKIKDKSTMKQRFQSATVGYDKLQLFLHL